MAGKKYPQPHNIERNFDTERVDVERIHNGIKRNGNGDPFCKYVQFINFDKICLPLMKRSSNGHKTNIYKKP